MLNLIIFILILSVLIVVHEFGHFLAARRNGVRVERFSIGFGTPIFKRKGKETDFWICAFPLGGYVKLAGDMRSEYHGHPFEFLSKPIGIKMKIVFFGPLFNFIFAFILFWVMGVVGFPYPDTVVGKVLEEYPAYEAGIQENDKVIEINDEKVQNWFEMSEKIYRSQEMITLKIERDGQILDFKVPLKEKEISDAFGRKRTVPIVGISASSKIKIVKYNFFHAFFKGVEATLRTAFFIVKGFTFMILGIVPFKEAVAGPLGIFYITSEALKIGIVAILHLMAVLNVSLTIVNLIPLPLLDGGHLFLFFIEKIRKKQISERTEDFITQLGFILIAFLIVFVFYNDVIRFGSKIWHGKRQETQQTLESKS
ncbi:MAG: RIP metalloprotease RseP [Candidatus Omnitrophota bacterium]|nr:MAG: RIP metalloprotease RseP [Candidatus Omnitrophota bacterium]